MKDYAPKALPPWPTSSTSEAAAMAEAARDFPSYSLEQYRQLLADSTVKLEFVDGLVYAMAGASNWHNLVSTNLIGTLNARLPERCRALGMDVQLRVTTATSDKTFFPDVFVTCGQPGLAHVHDDALIVIEVLSPTTEAYDRGSKMLSYRALSSLEAYLLVRPEQMHVELYARATGWQRASYGTGDTVPLDCLGLTIPVGDIYRRVPLVSGP
jgi:Uma2 family endonuclease